VSEKKQHIGKTGNPSEDTAKTSGKAKVKNSFSLDFSHKSLWNQLPFILFLAGLGLVYIWNSNNVYKKTVSIDSLEIRINDSIAEYNFLNAQVSQKRKLSEVAKTVDTLGLKPLSAPPYILVKEGDDE